MPDREKVIRGLECCCVKPAPKCEECPYADEVDGTCFTMDKMLADALALFKAQEARVMTLEEIEALPDGDDDNAPVCVEQRYPLDRWDGGAHAKWVGARFVHEEYLSDNRYYNRETYGITWRCWTGWPILAQREATPWS